MFNLGTAVGYLSLNAQQVVAGVQQAINAIRLLPHAASGALGDLSKVYQKNFFALRDIGVASGAVAAAVATGFAAAVNAAVDWERALAGVARTTYDAALSADQNEAALSKLNSQLRLLAATKPTAALDIANIAEEAGALGISSDKIAGFTSVIADLEATTDLTAEHATSSLARIGNIIDRTNPQFDRMGSTVLELGRSTAATEGEIVAMAKRIAGAGKTVGLSTDQVLAYAAALASVGVREEQGGSAISRTFIDIAGAVQEGGEKLELFAGVANKTKEQFVADFQRDAAGATNMFIEGLGRIQAAGGPVFTVLENLGITEIRQRDALLRLASAQGLLTQTLEKGAQSWQDNSALAEISARIYNTASAQIKELKNQVFLLGSSIGDALLPALKVVVGFISTLVVGFEAMPGPMKFATALLFSFVGILAAAAAVITFFIGRIQAANVALKALTANSLVASTAVTILQRSLGPLAFLLTAAAVTMSVFGARQKSTADETANLSAELDKLNQAVAEQVKGNEIAIRTWGVQKVAAAGLQDTLAGLGIGLHEVADAAAGSDSSIRFYEKFRTALDQAHAEAAKGGKQHEAYRKRLEELDEVIQSVIRDSQGARGAYHAQEEALRSAGIVTEDYTERLKEANDEYEKSKEKIDKQNEAMLNLVEARRAAAAAERGLTEAREKSEQAADKLAHKEDYLAQATGALDVANANHAAALREVADAQRTLSRARADAAEQVARSELDLEDAQIRVIESNMRVQDAELELTELRSDTENLKQIVELTNKLANTELKLREAHMKVADAEFYLNYLRSEGAGRRDLEEAQLALDKAKQEEVDITAEQADTQGELNDVRKDLPTQIIRAELDLRQARIDQQRAVMDEKRVEQDLNDARRALAEDTAYKDAQLNLLNAQQRVRDSVLEIQDATRTLHELQNGKLERDFAAAQQGLEDAHYRVATANVEVQKQLALSQGKTWTTTQAVQALKTELDKAAGAAGRDSPIGIALASLNDQLNAVGQPRAVNIAPPNIEPIKKALDDVDNHVKNSKVSDQGFWQSLGEKLSNFVGNVGSALKKGWDWLWDRPKQNNSVLGGVGNFLGLPFQHGGLAVGPKSGYPALLHGRELILPLDDMRRTIELLHQAGLASMASSSGTPLALAGATSTEATTVNNGDTLQLTAITNAPASEIINQYVWKQRVRKR